MLCICRSLFNGGNIAPKIDGGRGSKVGALGCIARLINGTVFQFVNGFTHSILRKGCSLGIPFRYGTTVGHHTVVLALFILRLEGSR